MVFTVVVIALILALNLFVTSVEDKLATKIDLSKKGLISISQDTDIALKTLGDSFSTTIYFLTSEDLLESTGNEKIYMVHELAKEYARRYPDCITIAYKDLNKDMAFLEKFKTKAQSTLTQDKIIVEGKYHAKIYEFSAFFVTDENSGEHFAFQGELKFTSAILQTAMNEDKQPIALFTSGHGETVKGISIIDSKRSIVDYAVSAINDEETYSAMVNAVPIFQMLDDSGFKIISADLSSENIPENTDLVVVSSPKSDFQGYTQNLDASTKTEINKIDDFVKSFKSLVVIVGDNTPEKMPNLTELMWEEYGLGFEANNKICDFDNCVLDGSSNGYDGLSVIANYAEGKGSLEHSILVNATSIKTIFRDPVKIKIDEEKFGTGESISTFNTASVFSKGEEVEKGEIPMLGVFCNYEFKHNNALQYKRVFLIGSDEFLSPMYVSGEYGNPYIFYAIARTATNNEIIPDGITYIKLDDEGLNAELLTSEVAQKWALRVSLYIPVVILIAGAIVWLRRRHL